MCTVIQRRASTLTDDTTHRLEVNGNNIGGNRLAGKASGAIALVSDANRKTAHSRQDLRRSVQDRYEGAGYMRDGVCWSEHHSLYGMIQGEERPLRISHW